MLRRCALPARLYGLHHGLRTATTCLGAATQHATRGAGSGTPDTAFHEAADAYIEHVMASVECKSDAAGDRLDDVDVADGVLNVNTSVGTFVLNKQAPKLQLWLSSPVSGPAHYDMAPSAEEVTKMPSAPGPRAQRWVSDRDGHRLDERLSQELTEALGTPVEC